MREKRLVLVKSNINGIECNIIEVSKKSSKSHLNRI